MLSHVRFPPVLRPVIRIDTPHYNDQWRDLEPRLTDIAADEAVLLLTQYSTQWDSLAHRGELFDLMATASRRRSTTTAFAPARTC